VRHCAVQPDRIRFWADNLVIPAGKNTDRHLQIRIVST
jgi:hypothetical protein